MNIYPFIEAERAERCNVARACAMLKVSRTAYYDWSLQVPSARERRDTELLGKITEIHKTSRRTYGSPRVHAQMQAEGEVCGHNRVARLMRKGGIVGRCKRRFRRTTIADPEATTTAVDLVKRAFGPGTIELDTLWCSERRRRKLLRDAQDRAHLPSRLADTRAGAPRDLRVHRGVLQSSETALLPGVSVPRRLREEARTTRRRDQGSGIVNVSAESGQAHEEEASSWID